MTDTFLKLDHIWGESLDFEHKHEIELLSWNWGGSHSIQNKASYEMKGKEAASSTEIGVMTITKGCDRASVTLAKYCALGKHIPTGIITCRKKDGESVLDYFTITMKRINIRDVHFSDGGQGEHGGHEIAETITLYFEEFEMEYVMQKNYGGPRDDGKGPSEATGDVLFGWNQKEF